MGHAKPPEPRFNRGDQTAAKVCFCLLRLVPFNELDHPFEFDLKEQTRMKKILEVPDKMTAGPKWNLAM